MSGKKIIIFITVKGMEAMEIFFKHLDKANLGKHGKKVWNSSK
jgi:hypothetical protein